MTLDENGVWHYWKILSADGSQREEVFMPEQPAFAKVQVIKSVCGKCNQERIIFDSRIHGYDGVMSEHSLYELEYRPQYKLKTKKSLKIQVTIENDNSLEDFVSNTGISIDRQTYSNAYSWIVIHGIDDTGKKKKLFDIETA